MIRIAVAVLAATLSLAAPAAAVAPAPPMILPARASAAAHGDPGWLVGARPVARAARIARAHGATRVSATAWSVARDRARGLAAALADRGLLAYAEPDRVAVRAQAPAPDPLAALTPWRDAIVPPGLVAPRVTAASPLLALVDSPIDTSHPELQGGTIRMAGDAPVRDAHGTGTAAIAAAPLNGVGFTGVWPGMRAVNLPLPPRSRCSDTTRLIRRAVRQGASVINMSYVMPESCFAEYDALQRATARGVALVAAAGNEFGKGNRPLYPASLPHVLTVAAVDSGFRSSLFSNVNTAVDIAAPGEGIFTAVPLRHDPDGRRDGYATLDGTSFAAPMAAAAVAWVRAARPELTALQAVQVVRTSARDLDREGYDANTGFGLLQVGAALAAPAPARDPAEPNEDVRWVGARRPLNGSRARVSITAMLDRYDDPRDVYRVVLPARGRLDITVRPRFGDADLKVHDGAVATVRSPVGRIGASLRDGTRTDRLVVPNRGDRARSAWVTVEIDEGARSLDSGYRLTIRRR